MNCKDKMRGKSFYLPSGEYLSKSQYARHRELFFAESSHTRISEQGATFTAPDPFAASDSSGDEMRENATGKLYKWTTITNIYGMLAKDCYSLCVVGQRGEAVRGGGGGVGWLITPLIILKTLNENQQTIQWNRITAKT